MPNRDGTGPQGTGPRETGPRGTGPRGTGPRGTGTGNCDGTKKRLGKGAGQGGKQNPYRRTQD